MDKMNKVFESEIRGIDEKEMTITAMISTNKRDRMDEVLDPAGVDFRNFNRNPVVMWAHDYTQPPIARALWTKRDGNNGIISKMKFASTPFAQEIFQLYREGFLKAWSVGFLPKEHQDGDGEKNPRRTYKKWELLEYSAVPIPANPEALALAMQNGILKTDAIIKAMEHPDKIGKDMEDAEQKPKPSKDESKDDFMARCIPQLVGEGKDKDQAIAICNSLWEDKGKAGQASLDELLAEVKMQQDLIEQQKEQIAELKYKIYQLGEKFTQLKETAKVAEPEITADSLAKKIFATVDGVVRKAKGKVS